MFTEKRTEESEQLDARVFVGNLAPNIVTAVNQVRLVWCPEYGVGIILLGAIWDGQEFPYGFSRTRIQKYFGGR